MSSGPRVAHHCSQVRRQTTKDQISGGGGGSKMVLKLFSLKSAGNSLDVVGTFEKGSVVKTSGFREAVGRSHKMLINQQPRPKLKVCELASVISP